MNHVSYEYWKKYVNNECTASEREEYEEHLYSCDQCLELYLQAVAEQEAQFPCFSNDDHFTDQVMAQIASHNQTLIENEPIFNIEEKQTKKLLTSSKRKKAKPFYQKTGFHYLVAAAMTLLLMTTGVFQDLIQYVDSVQKPEVKRASLTDELMNKTFAWKDAIEEKNKEGSK